MTISLKRAYERPSASDGYRILVERQELPSEILRDRVTLDEVRSCPGTSWASPTLREALALAPQVVTPHPEAVPA